jgi:hypothetical protein
MGARTWLSVAVVALVLTACGGDDGGGAGGDGGAVDLGDGSEDEIVNSVLDAASGALAETEEAPGLLRWVNLMQQDGAGVAVDVWWGRPEDGQLATTLAYGEASDYVSPRQSAAFGEVSWSMSAAGGQEQLIGYTYTPAEDLQQTHVAFPGDGGSSSMTQVDEILEFNPDIGAWGFQPPDSGQVRVKWLPISPVIEAPSGNLRNVGTGTAPCLTNGSGINAEDDLSTRSTTFQVPGGATVNLYEDFPTCSGPTSASATAPAGGRALLIAYTDASQAPQLLMLPVQG